MTTELMKTMARHWVVRLSDNPAPAVRAQFEDWLAQNPAHAHAYHQAAQVWNAVGDLRHLAPLAFGEGAGRPSWRARARPFGPFTIAATVLIAIGATFLVFNQDRPSHRTAVAEIRDVSLPDGSSATLGGRSAFETRYNRSERRIVLQEGEAIFDVARDPARPFVVIAGDLSVRALGTRFEVHRGAGEIRISVLEGLVEVAKPDETMRLAAGQQVTAPVSGKLIEASLKNVSQPVTWSSGVLRYEDASLAEVLADANRYYDRPIELSDPALGDLRLTTSFGTHQVEQLLESLPGVLPVRLDRSDPDRIVIFPATG